jgi:hypothetical protein
MRRTRLVCFIVGSLFALTEARAALPVPPNQRAPWKPPATTAMPDYVVKVADQLFNAGFADPRGGVYRKVEISNHHFDQSNRRRQERLGRVLSPVAGRPYRATDGQT